MYNKILVIMSWNYRVVSLVISIMAIMLYIMYSANSKYDSFENQLKLQEYERKIRLLKKDRESNIRRLQVLSWRWQLARDDREVLSRRLNRATEELNQLRCSLQDLQENFTETGAWCRWPFDNKHFTDTGLLTFLAKMLEGKSVGSFGEGPGQYKRYLLESGLVTTYDAYDGSPWIENMTNYEVKYLDLTIPQYGLPTYDWVLSIEVAEHIPREYEDIYLGNLIRHAKSGLILSWAVPGQSGFGHVNPRSNDYVEGKLKYLCFKKNKSMTNQIKRAADLIWLRRNLSVFVRKENCSLSLEDA